MRNARATSAIVELADRRHKLKDWQVAEILGAARGVSLKGRERQKMWERNDKWPTRL